MLTIRVDEGSIPLSRGEINGMMRDAMNEENFSGQWMEVLTLATIAPQFIRQAYRLS